MITNPMQNNSIFNVVDPHGTVWETGSRGICEEFIEKYPHMELQMESTTQDAEQIRNCERWIAQGGETPYWRYPPSGGEQECPVLPEGYSCIGDRNRYWVIGRA